MRKTTCPTAKDLGQYVVGQFDGSHREEIADHVEVCADCQAELQTVNDSGDTLVSMLRREASVDPYEEEPQCRDVLERIAAIGRDPSVYSAAQVDGAASSGETAAPGEPELGRIREYKLLAKLGEGGMGAVYKALHTKLKKVVAIKVLPAERMNNEQAVSRFEREMEAVGKLEHVNIVRATDAGEHDGNHFLVMELVDGVDLSALAKQVGPLGTADACELIRQAAVGLQEAHEHGMVHRDIKPSNLMISARKRKPPVVKILDMGLALVDEARLENNRGLTSTGQIMGTVDYMAPEQGLDCHDVDARADIYSLGATLFRLLCGEPLFSPSVYNTPMKVLMALGTERAPSIATKRDDLPPELIAAVDRMLARKPEERFATPQDVADALEPLAAGSDLAALLNKVTEENTGSAADELALATRESLKSGSVETTRTTDVKSRPAPGTGLPTPPKPSTEGLHQPEFGRPAVEPVARSGNLATAQGATAHTAGLATTPAHWWQKIPPAARIAVAVSLGGVLLLAAVLLTIRTPHGEVLVELGEGVKPEEVKIEVSGGGDVKVIDAKSNWTIEVAEGKYDVRLNGGEDRLKLDTNSVLVTRNEAMRVRVTLRGPTEAVAAGSRRSPGAEPDRAMQPMQRPQLSEYDKLRREDIDPYDLKMVEQWPDVVAVLGTHRGKQWTAMTCMALSPDGKQLATGDGKDVRLWDADTLETLGTLPAHEGAVHSAAYSPDGKWLASGGYHKTILLWDRTTTPPDVRQRIQLEDAYPTDLLFTVDSGSLFAATSDGKLRQWDLSGDEPTQTTLVDDVREPLRLTPGGGLLLCPNQTCEAVRIFSLASGEPRERAVIHEKYGGSNCDYLVLSPDGESVAFSSNTPFRIEWWDISVDPPRRKHEFEGQTAPLAFSQDGRELIGTRYVGGISMEFWNLSGEAPRISKTLQMPGNPGGLAVVSDGVRLFGDMSKQSLFRLDLTASDPVVFPAQGHFAIINALSVSPDGRSVVSTSFDGLSRHWRLNNGKYEERQWLSYQPRSMSVTADGRTIAVDQGYACHHDDIWDVSVDEPKLLGRVPDATCPVAISPDGSKVAAPGGWTTRRHDLILWDLTKLNPDLVDPEAQELATLGTFPHGIGQVEFSPNSRIVGAAVVDGSGQWDIHLWDLSGPEPKELPTSGSFLYRPAGSGTRNYRFKFSPDGNSLATFTTDRLYLWDLTTEPPAKVYERQMPPHISGSVINQPQDMVQFSPDGRLIVTAAAADVSLWDAATGERLRDWRFPGGHYGGVYSIAFAPDGRHLVTANFNGTLYVVRLEEPPLSTPVRDTADAARRSPEGQLAGAWQPGPAENVLPGLIPRPARLPGIRRWQVVPMPLEANVWLSPDGSYLAWMPAPGASDHYYLVLQETESRRTVGYLPLPQASKTNNDRSALAWHPDSTRLAVKEGNNVYFMDVKGEIQLACRIPGDFIAGGAEIGSLTWSPDGETLAVTEGRYQTVRLVAKDGAAGPVIKWDKGPVATAWSPDGREFAVQPDADRAVRVFGVDGSVRAELTGLPEFVKAVAWSPDGKWIAAGSQGGEVRLWQPDGTAGPSLATSGDVHAISWSPDSERLAFHVYLHSTEPGVKVWQPGNDVFTHIAGHSSFKTIHWSPDSKWLVLSQDGGRSANLFAPDGNKGRTMRRGIDNSVAWSHDGSRILLVDKQRITQWFGVDGREFPEVTSPVACSESSMRMAWSPDGRHLAVTGGIAESHPVWLWNAEGDFEAVVRQGNRASVGRLAWSPDSTSFAAAGTAEKLRLWNVDGTPGPVLDGNYIVAWSPDGKWLASRRHPDSGIQLWRPDGTKGPVVEKGINQTGTCAIAWSPDGERFAVVSAFDEPVEVDGKQFPANSPLLSVHHMDGSSGPVFECPATSMLAWSPDGEWIAAAGTQSVSLWHADGKPGPPLESRVERRYGASHIAWSPASKSLTAIEGANTGNYVNRWGIDGKLQDSRRLGRDALQFDSTIDGTRLAIADRKGVVEVIDDESREVQWIAVPLSDGQAVSFTAAGQLIHGAPEIVDQLIYVVEKPDGQFAALSRKNFLGRVSLPPDQLALWWLIEASASFTVEGDDRTYSAANVRTMDVLPDAGNSAVYVNLRGNEHFTATDLTMLASLPNLAGLDVSGTNIGSPALEQIGKLHSLTTLDLSDTAIANPALAQLAGLENLTTLRLKKTIVSTAGLEYLAGMTQLSELDLSGTGVSDLGLKALAECTNLSQLNLAGTSVTPTGASALREKLPQCEIQREPDQRPGEDTTQE